METTEEVSHLRYKKKSLRRNQAAVPGFTGPEPLENKFVLFMLLGLRCVEVDWGCFYGPYAKKQIRNAHGVQVAPAGPGMNKHLQCK